MERECHDKTAAFVGGERQDSSVQHILESWLAYSPGSCYKTTRTHSYLLSDNFETKVRDIYWCVVVAYELLLKHPMSRPNHTCPRCAHIKFCKNNLTTAVKTCEIILHSTTHSPASRCWLHSIHHQHVFWLYNLEQDTKYTAILYMIILAGEV